MNGLLRKLMLKLGMRWATGQIRAIAEGKKGERLQRFYWTLAGGKRVTGLLLGVAAGVAQALGYASVAVGLGTVGGVLLALGFVDANWRETAESDWLKDSAVWKFLAHNSPTVTAGLLAAAAWLQSPTSCTLGEWCVRGALATAILGAAFVQIGVVDAAWNAPAPQVPLP
jgi:hypothetical protein